MPLLIMMLMTGRRSKQRRIQLLPFKMRQQTWCGENAMLVVTLSLKMITYLVMEIMMALITYPQEEASSGSNWGVNKPTWQGENIFRVVEIVIMIMVIGVINDDGDTGMMLSKLIALQQHHVIVYDNVLCQTRCYQLSVNLDTNTILAQYIRQFSSNVNDTFVTGPELLERQSMITINNIYCLSHCFFLCE